MFTILLTSLQKAQSPTSHVRLRVKAVEQQDHAARYLHHLLIRFILILLARLILILLLSLILILLLSLILILHRPHMHHRSQPHHSQQALVFFPLLLLRLW
jgi:hypothetical protein